MTKLSEIKRAARALTHKQLSKLDAWIHALLEGAESVDHRPVAKGVRRHGHKTYRRELVRCGKKGCKCAEGKLHGPYWSEGGRTKSQYVGKRLPKGIKIARGMSARGVR